MSLIWTPYSEDTSINRTHFAIPNIIGVLSTPDQDTSGVYFEKGGHTAHTRNLGGQHERCVAVYKEGLFDLRGANLLKDILSHKEAPLRICTCTDVYCTLASEGIVLILMK